MPKKVAEGIDRVRKIVQDLKDFARRRRQLRLGRCACRHRFDAEHRRQRSQVQGGRRPGIRHAAREIECIPSQLNQVVMNLLVNAAQAMSGEPRGTITVRTGFLETGAESGLRHRSGSRSLIRKRHRAGASGAHLRSLFTTKPVGRGRAWGCRCLTASQKHHGHIEVDSVQGRGTRFRISLSATSGASHAIAPVCGSRQEGVMPENDIGQSIFAILDTVSSSVYVHAAKTSSLPTPRWSALPAAVAPSWRRCRSTRLLPGRSKRCCASVLLPGLRGEHVPLAVEFRVVSSKRRGPVVDVKAALVRINGKPTIVGSFYDLTERRRSELVQRKCSCCSQIIDGDPVPTIVIDAEHRVTHWNMAWRFDHRNAGERGGGYQSPLGAVLSRRAPDSRPT